jgi:hypothetical protein
MMFERFTDEARTIVALASGHARRLGHRYVGGEHILLAAVTAGQPASAVLCAHGVTPELVEEEIVRRVGLGAGAGLFGGLDKDALATIGIDLDAVRARIEASFGPQALARAAQAAQAVQRDLRRRPGPRPPCTTRISASSTSRSPSPPSSMGSCPRSCPRRARRRRPCAPRSSTGTGGPADRSPGRPAQSRHS